MINISKIIYIGNRKQDYSKFDGDEDGAIFLKRDPIEAGESFTKLLAVRGSSIEDPMGSIQDGSNCLLRDFLKYDKPSVVGSYDDLWGLFLNICQFIGIDPPDCSDMAPPKSELFRGDDRAIESKSFSKQ